MLFILTGILLAAPVTVAAPGLRSFGVDPKLVDTWLDRTITVLSSSGVKVTSHSDLEQAIGLERQRQLLGCADSGSGSCLAELAGALGVDALLVGSVAKSESGYTVTLRLVGTRNGDELAAASGRFKEEGALLDWLDETAPQLAAKLQGATGHAPVSGISRGVPTIARWSPAFLGVVAAGISIGLLVLSQQAASQLRQPQSFHRATDIEAVASDGRTFQTVGWALTGVSAALLAAGALWGLLGGAGKVHVGLLVQPGGALASLEARWP